MSRKWLPALVVLSLTSPALSRVLYPGQYAQIEPELRNWFYEQRVPGTRNRCCSDADGTKAGEDIRDGHYWVRFAYLEWDDGVQTEHDSGWMQVPDGLDDNVVLTTPNLNGAPTVWYQAIQGQPVKIRCFSPGPKS